MAPSPAPPPPPALEVLGGPLVALNGTAHQENYPGPARTLGDCALRRLESLCTSSRSLSLGFHSLAEHLDGVRAGFLGPSRVNRTSRSETGTGKSRRSGAPVLWKIGRQVDPGAAPRPSLQLRVPRHPQKAQGMEQKAQIQKNGRWAGLDRSLSPNIRSYRDCLGNILPPPPRRLRILRAQSRLRAIRCLLR